MKTERNILIAFLLNLSFSIFEFFGGIITGSVAIVSDAIHDIGDAAGIGVSYFLEKKSKKQPDERYTYGYARYSVIGSVITMLILLIGSVLVIYNAIERLITPTDIHYDGMIVFAIVGVCVNFLAAFFTREGDSLNQKAVNLHMLEDVLGWVIVLIGAIVMRFTDLRIIDPIMSIGVAAFIFYNACRGMKEALDLLLERTPHDIDLDEIREHLCEIEGVASVHHIHLWSMDGVHHYATLHAVITGAAPEVKHRIREELREHDITHVTIEVEAEGETCDSEHCHVETNTGSAHAHHHHHHHGHHHEHGHHEHKHHDHH